LVLNEKELSSSSAIAGLAQLDDVIVGAEAVRKDSSDATPATKAKVDTPATKKPHLKLDVLPNLLPPGARCLVKSPGYSNRLAVCSSDGRVDLWDFYSGFEHKRTIQAHAGKVNAIAFHPSGEFFATAGDDGMIRLFSADGEPIQAPIHRSGRSIAINALAFVDA
jgi:WD40 repeat protein